jgi:hypothetical protein
MLRVWKPSFMYYLNYIILCRKYIIIVAYFKGNSITNATFTASGSEERTGKKLRNVKPTCSRPQLTFAGAVNERIVLTLHELLSCRFLASWGCERSISRVLQQIFHLSYNIDSYGEYVRNYIKKVKMWNCQTTNLLFLKNYVTFFLFLSYLCYYFTLDILKCLLLNNIYFFFIVFIKNNAISWK